MVVVVVVVVMDGRFEQNCVVVRNSYSDLNTIYCEKFDGCWSNLAYACRWVCHVSHT